MLWCASFFKIQQQKQMLLKNKGPREERMSFDEIKNKKN